MSITNFVKNLFTSTKKVADDVAEKAEPMIERATEKPKRYLKKQQM